MNSIRCYGMKSGGRTGERIHVACPRVVVNRRICSAVSSIILLTVQSSTVLSAHQLSCIPVSCTLYLTKTPIKTPRFKPVLSRLADEALIAMQSDTEFLSQKVERLIPVEEIDFGVTRDVRVEVREQKLCPSEILDATTTCSWPMPNRTNVPDQTEKDRCQSAADMEAVAAEPGGGDDTKILPADSSEGSQSHAEMLKPRRTTKLAEETYEPYEGRRNQIPLY